MFGPRGNEPDNTEIHPANERSDYTLTNKSDTHYYIKKTYELKTAGKGGAQPFLHLTGEGEVRFDRKLALIDRYNFKLKFTVNEGNRSETVPVTIDVKLLSPEEVAARKQDRERRMAEAKKRSEERKVKENSPETLRAHLAKLNDGEPNFGKHYRVLNAVQKMTPADHEAQRKAVLNALRRFLSSDNSSLKRTGQTAFAKWADKTEFKTLVQLLGETTFSNRGAVITALGRIGGKEAAVAIAPMLAELSNRRDAAKALEKIGKDAEDAVIGMADHKDLFTRMAVYDLLGKIGGDKSKALLKAKAVEDNHGSARGAAQRAYQALKK